MRPSLAILLLAMFAALPLKAEGQRELVVYTYESFVGEYGPGDAIAAKFEATCGCDVRFVGAGDGAALLARLRLEGARSPADIVLGLDTDLVAEAKATGLFAAHGMTPPPLDLPVAWDDPVFLPYDWSYLAFVYDTERVATPPDSFRALIDSDLSVVIEDPRSSTPGLALVLWVKKAYGDEAPAIWEGLRPRILTVTPGWGEAYGMFAAGETDMVLSYSTSPAYHLIAEDDPTKAAAMFEEGHYLQIELAAATANAPEPELARDFLAFMLTDAFQSEIPTANWSYPARIPEGGLPAGFETLRVPQKALLYDPEEARAVRDAALDEWLTALSR